MADENDLIAQYEVGADNDETLIPSEAPPEDPAPQAAPATKPTYLVELGKQFGMTDEDMAELDADTLGKTVKHLARQARQSERHERASFEAATERREPVAQVPSEPDLFSPQEQEELHPSVTKGFKALTDRLSRIEKALEQVTGHVVAQANMTRTEQIDAGFADLGEEFAPVFGKGYGAEMKGEDPALKRRRAVLSSLELDKPKGGTLRDNVKRRALELFGWQAQQTSPRPQRAPTPPAPAALPEEQRPRDESGRFISADRWQQAALAVPTSRNGAAEPNGREKAVRSVTRALREETGYDEYDLPPGSLPD